MKAVSVRKKETIEQKKEQKKKKKIVEVGLFSIFRGTVCNLRGGWRLMDTLRSPPQSSYRRIMYNMK